MSRPAAVLRAPEPVGLAQGARVIRAGSASVLLRPRVIALSATAVAVLGAAIVGHLLWAGRPLGLGQVLGAFADDPSLSRAVRLTVLEFRLPRTLAGAVAGACLAVAGGITQTVARNPLATPEILGVTAGASTGAVAVVVLAGAGHGGASGLAAAAGMPIAAAIGAFGAGTAVFLLTQRRGGREFDSTRLVLVGLGIAGLASSLTTWLLTLGDVTNAAQALTWMMGSLNGRDWGAVVPSLVAAVPLLLAAAGCGRWLAVSSFDDDTARGLGLPLATSRPLLLGLAVLLAALGTVLAGPVAFVALMCPLAAKSLARAVVPPLGVTALLGAVFVVLSDLAAGFLLPHAVPVGVFTTVLGAPVLIVLVRRSQKRPT